MATKIFKTQPGLVQAIDLGGGAPGVLSIKGPGGELTRKEEVIVTSIGVGQQVNIQFAPSLQKVIYVYSFGDRIGQVAINGVAFDKTCNKRSGYVGAKTILDYYEDSRAIDEGRIIKISLGGRTFQGYLTAMDLRTSSPELKLMGFTLTVIIVPEQAGLKT